MTYNPYTWEYPNLICLGMAGPHRDTTYYNLVCDKETQVSAKVLIGEIPYGVCQLAYDEKWWIVPIMFEDEPFNHDIGPFDTMSEAMVCMKLSGTTIT